MTRSVERFNPRTRQFAVVIDDELPAPRFDHRATRLLTGDVFVTGGLTVWIQFCFAPRESVREYLTPTPTATATATAIADLIR